MEEEEMEEVVLETASGGEGEQRMNLLISSVRSSNDELSEPSKKITANHRYM